MCRFIAPIDSVHAFKKAIFNYLKARPMIDIDFVHHFSDGATSQFKSRYKICYLLFHEEEFGFLADHTYFETSHGKDPHDGVGGEVERMILRSELQKKSSKWSTRFCKCYCQIGDDENLPEKSQQSISLEVESSTLSQGKFVLCTVLSEKNFMFRYVCIVQELLSPNDVQVMGLKAIDNKGINFKANESDIFTISKSDVLLVLPDPLMECRIGSDRVRYKFNSPIVVNEA
ncbi:hypothetical protein PR048_015398 [Dryococelus australis]|uniref:Uncharacterized protein n=1 Tax=Dryococelus australis TaxID=614101 RepID=A0ABQ9HH46_9NEOP|nr:hypothetical protein PR048_015398 [Dryococelus australis]